MNDAEDGIGDNERDLSEEHRTVGEQLKQIMVEGRTGDGIICKKVSKRALKVQMDRVNKAIKYLKNKNITEINNFIRAASVGGRTDRI